MGWFSPKVPNTISDKKMAELQRRARRADKKSMFDKEAVRRRLASSDQKRKAWWS